MTLASLDLVAYFGPFFSFFLSFGSCNLGSLNSFFVIFIFVRMSFGTFSSFILFFGCIFFLNFLLKFACLDR